MTTWTTIADASLNVGKPTRSIDAKALRDNPIAMAEGRPGAPSITPWAMARAPVTAGDVTCYKDPVTLVKVSDSNRSTAENVNLTGVSTPVHSVAIMNNGTVRVKWTQGRAIGTGSGGPLGLVARVRAGVYTALSSELGNSNNAAQEAKSYDATVEPGDTIVWMLRPNTNGQTMQMYNFELATDGGLLHPMPAYFTFGSEPT